MAFAAGRANLAGGQRFSWIPELPGKDFCIFPALCR